MRSSTGRWVSGDDFFDRELELRALEGRIRDFNHVLLTGQRRMGKTSITRELGRRVEAKGWGFIPADVQGATCPEDVIASIAEKAHPIRSIARRFATAMHRWVEDRIEEVSAYDFRIRIRSGLDAANWRRHGEHLLHVFTVEARHSLERLYSALVDDAPGRVSDALEVLIHDGYLEAGDDGHRFLSRLLKDWWSARFRDHHTPLLKRPSARPRWFR